MASERGTASRAFNVSRIGCSGLLILAFLFLVCLKPYTDYLWFSQDVRHPEVFTLAYATKGQLFVFAFLIAIAVYAFSFTKALGVTMVYLRQPETMGEAVIANTIAWIQRNGPTVVKIAAVVLAFLAALGFSNEWQTWILARNGESFGVKDPTFGRDLGFFVFDLPWFVALANFAFSLFFLGLVVTFGIYFGLEFLASLGKIEVSKPFVRMHLSVLATGLLLASAARLWLGRYEIGYIQNPQFTGGGYAEQLKLSVQAILAFGLVPLAIAILWNARAGRPYRAAMWGGGVWAGAYVIGMWVFPFIVQRFTVEPNKISVESPYAQKAMDMTRFGYALDRIVVKDTAVNPSPTPEELALAQPTLENMRLWDPEVLRETIEPIQSLRAFYRFHDVDIDRYTLLGKQKLLMLSPRDIDLGGLQASAKTWVNERLQYTHGYGIVACEVDATTSEGRPELLVKDFPPKSVPGLEIKRPQLYFADTRDEYLELADEYSIVGTRVDEYDYPSETDAVFNRWEEPRGVSVGGTLVRMAYSALFADGNLLISSNVTKDSKLLYRRNVIERARLVYPFLSFDGDPYIVILNGKIIWVLDGYTSTSRVPYSDIATSSTKSLNYIRNSVKLTIDAYSGEMKAYAVEPGDPLLKTWRKIYPRLVSELSEAPQGLAEHFRYPEDMFMLQAGQLTQYHVKTPASFLNNDDAWDLPVERGRTGHSTRKEAYYVQTQLPDESKDHFLLILPMTPRTKGNMAGWLAAHCDPGEYGRLVLYRYPKNSNTPGPAQMESSFNQDRDIANLNKLFNSEQSELVQGNLLVIPIGKSVIYVKPLFLKSLSGGIQAIPELKKVILATSERIVVADSYGEALKQLFGLSPVPIQQTVPLPSPQKSGISNSSNPYKADLKALLELSDQAEAALRAGDFAKYGELQKRVRAKLEAMAK